MNTILEKTDLVRTNQGVVVMTRQRDYLGAMPRMLDRLGFESISIPLMSVDGISESDHVQTQFDNIRHYTDIVFVSRNAVDYGVGYVNSVGGLPTDINVYAVGMATAAALYEHLIDSHFPAHGHGAEALLKSARLQDLSNRKVLIVRGETGLDWMRDEMVCRGAEVEYAICYKTKKSAYGQLSLLELFEKCQQKNKLLSAIFIHSGQVALSFLSIVASLQNPYKEVCQAMTVVAGSQRIANIFKENSWHAQVLVANSPNSTDMVAALAPIYRNTK